MSATFPLRFERRHPTSILTIATALEKDPTYARSMAAKLLSVILRRVRVIARRSTTRPHRSFVRWLIARRGIGSAHHKLSADLTGSYQDQAEVYFQEAP